MGGVVLYSARAPYGTRVCTKAGQNSTNENCDLMQLTRGTVAGYVEPGQITRKMDSVLLSETSSI